MTPVKWYLPKKILFSPSELPFTINEIYDKRLLLQSDKIIDETVNKVIIQVSLYLYNILHRSSDHRHDLQIKIE